MKTEIVSKEMKDGIAVYHLKRVRAFKDLQKMKSTRITQDHYDLIVDHDADGYDAATGDLLFRFRKKLMPMEILMAGVDNYKHSVKPSNQRGDAAGGTKTDEKGNSGADDKMSGNVGYMDPGARTRYCRLTGFGRDHFDTYFKQGRPFVEYIDEKYKELCPEHHRRQLNTANETNANYVLWDTAFSTITVNRNFRTFIHQDDGDHPEGFGNLFVYREGDWKRGYFVLPGWSVGIDMQNQDMLFVDVHRFHGNDNCELDGEETEFDAFEDDLGGPNLRMSFVLYYRTGLRPCKSPKEQVEYFQQRKSGYMRL